MTTNSPAGAAPDEPPKQDAYPRFVERDRRRRWDLCVAGAERLMGEDASAGQVRSVAEVLFHDRTIPTD